MTADRAAAYQRTMKTLTDLGPSKFHELQQEVIREAADSLLFCEDLAADNEAIDALARLHSLAEHLLDNDLLVPETVERLLADVEACGPVPVRAEPVAV